MTETGKQNDGSETKDYEVLEKIGAGDGICGAALKIQAQDSPSKVRLSNEVEIDRGITWAIFIFRPFAHLKYCPSTWDSTSKRFRSNVCR